MDRRLAGIELTPRLLATVGAALGILAAIVFAYHRLDVATLRTWAEHMNGVAVFAALTVLPLLGFPVSVLHVVVGARFGLRLGLPLVAASIVLQLFASCAIVRIMPGFLGRKLEPLRRRLPRAAHASLTLFTILLPGAPYFAQNYLLPLMGVPLRTFILIAFPLHLMRSVVSILFGEVFTDFTWPRALGFGAYAVTLTLIWAMAFRRLRSQWQAPPPAAGGRTRPA